MDDGMIGEDRLKMPRSVFSSSCCLRFKFSPEEIEQRCRSQEIDKMIEKDRQHLRKQFKLLLLGAGESGKSTFLKQMKIIHGIKFEPDQIGEYQTTIYQNVIRGMKVLVDARNKLLGDVPWESEEIKKYGNEILQFENNTKVDTRLFTTYVPRLTQLWTDRGIRRAYERRREFQLSDSVYYFLENLDRISRIDYIPTNKDILHARKATKGISDFTITINNYPFRFVDVGGQRSQRQKWFLCFEHVTSILFLVSSSEFDQVLVEDRETNRLVESQNIFDTIINNIIFKNVSFILFLNKTDLLEEKLNNRETDISWYFPEFKGDSRNLEEVQAFLVSFFERVKRNNEKLLYHHFTTAVDTENIRAVFNAVKETILRKNLRDVGLF